MEGSDRRTGGSGGKIPRGSAPDWCQIAQVETSLLPPRPIFKMVINMDKSISLQVLGHLEHLPAGKPPQPPCPLPPPAGRLLPPRLAPPPRPHPGGAPGGFGGRPVPPGAGCLPGPTGGRGRGNGGNRKREGGARRDTGGTREPGGANSPRPLIPPSCLPDSGGRHHLAHRRLQNRPPLRLASQVPPTGGKGENGGPAEDNEALEKAKEDRRRGEKPGGTATEAPALRDRP